ncbi:MAG TPA: TusE/DsrC/DsvC family sulfur relay protein [Acidimicrobiia bacterium]|nr:TusE/DsrC/DsvC family sulfur relay protein [Acidimicrobiia bacterium]
MTTALIAGREIHVDEEGFMTDPAEWNEEMAAVLAKNIGIDELTPDHWKVIRYLREDLAAQGETPTLRRVSLNIGITTKQLFELFPKKPGKKMAYLAGVPKPKGCI